MAWLGVVTNAGKELLGGWLAGQQLQIAGAAGGSGTVQEAALLAQTGLVEQKQTASIVSYKTVEGGQKIKLQFPAATAAYQLNQIGVWGNCGGENKLLALFQNPEGVAISSRAEFPDFAYTFYAVLAIGNEGALAVTVDAEAWVTIKTLQEALEGYVKVNAEGKIPDEVLPAMDYIPKTEKNAADGVAGLDANKKVVIAQLPMDTALSNTSENPVQNKVVYAVLAGKVPTTRKVNGKALSADISLTAADVGARPSDWTPTAANVGAVPTSRKVNGKALNADISLSAADVGALASNGKAGTAGTADTAKACSGNAATATKLATARSIRTNLASGSAVNFDGSGNITPGVFGILPVANGGTGANSAAAARNALGIVNSVFTRNASGNTGVVQGGASVNINIGFTPKILFIMGASSLGSNDVSNEPSILLGNGHVGISTHYVVTFTNTGFSVSITISTGYPSYGFAYHAFG